MDEESTKRMVIPDGITNTWTKESTKRMVIPDG
jgi:hypothetical protein